MEADGVRTKQGAIQGRMSGGACTGSQGNGSRRCCIAGMVCSAALSTTD